MEDGGRAEDGPGVGGRVSGDGCRVSGDGEGRKLGNRPVLSVPSCFNSNAEGRALEPDLLGKSSVDPTAR
jgi:hypothetical protein